MSTDQANAITGTGPVARLSSLRTELVALLETLSETRLSKPTAREGWTLRHEICWLAAVDEELRQRLEHAAGSSAEEPQWRRVRGVAMFEAQDLRLAALREHLVSSGSSVAASLETHAARLEEPAIHDAIEAHHADTATAIETLRAALAK